MDEEKGGMFSDIDGTMFREQLSFHHMEKIGAMKHLPPHLLEHVSAARRAWQHREKPFHHHDQLLIDILLNEMKGIPQAISVEAGKAAAMAHGKRVHTFPREVLSSFHDASLPTFAISGSPGDVVRPFATRLGMCDIRATEFEVDGDEMYTGKVSEDWLSRQHKGDAVVDLATKHCVNLGESVAIGDTRSDIRMLEKVGYPICYNPNREMKQLVSERRWPIVIERKDVWLALTWSNGGYVECEHLELLLPPAVRKRFLIRESAHHRHNSKPAP